MAKIAVADLISAFEEMTLLELKDFRDQFKEHFDVQAAAPMMAVAGPGAGGGDAAAEEEQSAFDVILASAGEKKIQVIKEVRALTNLGLKEAKELVDGAPKAVLEGATKEDADKAKESLEAAGATVELK